LLQPLAEGQASREAEGPFNVACAAADAGGRARRSASSNSTSPRASAALRPPLSPSGSGARSGSLPPLAPGASEALAARAAELLGPAAGRCVGAGAGGAAAGGLPRRHSSACTTAGPLYAEAGLACVPLGELRPPAGRGLPRAASAAVLSCSPGAASGCGGSAATAAAAAAAVAAAAGGGSAPGTPGYPNQGLPAGLRMLRTMSTPDIAHGPGGRASPGLPPAAGSPGSPAGFRMPPAPGMGLLTAELPPGAVRRGSPRGLGGYGADGLGQRRGYGAPNPFVYAGAGAAASGPPELPPPALWAGDAPLMVRVGSETHLIPTAPPRALATRASAPPPGAAPPAAPPAADADSPGGTPRALLRPWPRLPGSLPDLRPCEGAGAMQLDACAFTAPPLGAAPAGGLGALAAPLHAHPLWQLPGFGPPGSLGLGVGLGGALGALSAPASAPPSACSLPGGPALSFAGFPGLLPPLPGWAPAALPGLPAGLPPPAPPPAPPAPGLPRSASASRLGGAVQARAPGAGAAPLGQPAPVAGAAVPNAWRPTGFGGRPDAGGYGGMGLRSASASCLPALGPAGQVAWMPGAPTCAHTGAHAAVISVRPCAACRPQAHSTLAMHVMGACCGAAPQAPGGQGRGAEAGSGTNGRTLGGAPCPPARLHSRGTWAGRTSMLPYSTY